jgi:hypothetical protein
MKYVVFWDLVPKSLWKVISVSEEYINSIFRVEVSSYIAYIRMVQLFSSLGPRIVLLSDPRAKKPLLALLLKTNSQFLLSLTILIQKRQITIVYVQL